MLIKFNTILLGRLPKKQQPVVVADSDQSIYSWRGIATNIEQRLKKDFPKAKILLLKQNDRSTKNILKVTHTVIKNNPNWIKKYCLPREKTQV